MPPRPSLAARRFYRTFYHWTILTNNAIPLSQRHAFHTTTRTGDENNEANRSLSRKDIAVAPEKSRGDDDNNSAGESNRQGGKGGRNRRRSQQLKSGSGSGSGSGTRHLVQDKKSIANSSDRAFRYFRDFPILSPSQKAFSSFKSREGVVRYRSNESIMLECAVSNAALTQARAIFGPALESISQRSGALIEAQNISAPAGPRPGDRIHSVLISGTFLQVSLAKEYLFTGITPESDFVRSQEDLPSNLMLPWRYALRACDESRIIAEVSTPEDQWALVAGSKDWGLFAKTSGITMELGVPELRPVCTESDQMALARSLILKGPPSGVRRFHGTLVRTAGDPKYRLTTQTVPAPSVGTTVAQRAEGEERSTSSTTSPVIKVSPGDVTDDKPPSRNSSFAKEPPPKENNAFARCIISIRGDDAFRPALIDAVSREIEDPGSGVSMHRPAKLEEKIPRQWNIEIIGPSSAVNSTRVQVKALVEDVRRRLGLKQVKTAEEYPPGFKYLFTVTGRDSDAVLAETMKDTSWLKELSSSGDVRLTWPQSRDNSEDWQLNIKSNPDLIGQVEKRLQRVFQQVGERLGKRDFQTTLSFDTYDLKLPILGSEHRSAGLIEQKSVLSAAKKDETRQMATKQMADRPVVTPPAIRSSDQAGRERSPRIEEQQQSQLSHTVRASLRSLTHPVVLVTSFTKVGSAHLSPEMSARGVTVSSFNAVTLDPRPIVSFNIKVPSRSWDAMCQSGRLCVHLLEASSRGAAVAHVFTKPHDRPEMGFAEVRKLGLRVRFNAPDQAPAVLDQHGAVLARFEAQILLEKCVTIGDHVVVLAEVTNVASENSADENVDGLAYARRGYRTRGNEVMPAELPGVIEDDLNDPLTLAAEKPATQSPAPLEKTLDERRASDPHASFNLDHDSIFNALRLTKDAADSGQDIDVYAAMSMDDDNFGDDAWSSGKKSSSSSPASKSHSHEEIPTAQYRIHRPLRIGDRGDNGLTWPQRTQASPSVKRAFSTHIKTSSSDRSSPSTPIEDQIDGDDSHMMDPAAKTTTVADYFGVPDNNERPPTPRVRSLLRLQKDIRAAESRLENEELDEEESATLQNSVLHLNRIITRKLAWNAARDLRLMLDKGNARVDFKRAQWLESAVEEGLNVLLEDAKRLRQKREEGKVNAERYEELKQKLESDHGVLQTELMRLREVADEDQDGGD